MTDKPLDRFLDEYKRDHQHPLNQLSHVIGVPLILASLVLVFFRPAAGVGLFVFGWILQFIGHAFEGKAPSFLRNPRFILGGPAWLANRIVARVRGRASTEPTEGPR